MLLFLGLPGAKGFLVSGPNDVSAINKCTHIIKTKHLTVISIVCDLQDTLDVEEGPELTPELDIIEEPRLLVKPIKDVFGIPKF